ncbi:MAG: hypothetical protein CR975_02195 [Gammaproteobacteria bacterium]|nr:MAG: hypothetical protein CR975_02195 [Gammaproteobacteria bacterium]
MQGLLDLPFQVQAVIVSGYIGYVIAHRDYRKTEKITDMWMMILIFGFPTGLLLTIFDSALAYSSIVIGPIIAFLWNKFGKKRFNELLRKAHISYETNEGDVWNTLATRKGVTITQLTVTLKNGRKYHCSDTAKFQNEEFTPCLIDDDGIAFYVDKFIDSQGKWSEDDETLGKMGSLITYFPRNDITLLEARFK